MRELIVGNEPPSTGEVASQSEWSLTAMISRCGCGNPDSHSKENKPCPHPRIVEDIGELADLTIIGD